MSRPRGILRPIPLTLKLPEDERTRLDLFLYSDLESKVPFGAYQRFFLARLNEFFTWKTLDLGPYLGTTPGTFAIRGNPEVLKALEAHLKGER